MLSAQLTEGLVSVFIPAIGMKNQDMLRTSLFKGLTEGSNRGQILGPSMNEAKKLNIRLYPIKDATAEPPPTKLKKTFRPSRVEPWMPLSVVFQVRTEMTLRPMI